MASGWKLLKEWKQQDYTVARTKEIIVERQSDRTSHPRFILEARDWCNIIPVTKDGRLVMVRQFRAGAWQDSLEVPGGIVDPGEAPKDAAVRELEEETGYRPREVISLGKVHPNPAFQGNHCHSYLALDCEPGIARPEHGEEIAVELIERGAVPELVRTGVISHALCIGAFYLESIRER